MHGHEVYGEGLDIWYFQEFDIWNHWYLVGLGLGAVG